MRFLVLACLVSLLTPVIAAERPLRFAPLPMIDSETMADEFLGPVRYLEKQLGRPVELVYTPDYQTLIDGFRRDEIDIAYIGPLPYVVLTKGFDGAEPLARFRESDGKEAYTCALVVFGDAPVSAEAVRNKRLALPDRLSTCADVGAQSTLGSLGINAGSLHREYLGRHDGVALAVILGQADVGNLKTAVARRYTSLGLRIVAESRPFPGFVMVANRHTLSDAWRGRLREALLAIDPKKTAAGQGGWGYNMRYGAVPAKPEDFAFLRQLWGQRTPSDH